VIPVYKTGIVCGIVKTSNFVQDGEIALLQGDFLLNDEALSG
jgi:hypothetical protein